MQSNKISMGPAGLMVLLLLTFISRVQADYVQALCSPQNTGTEGPHLSNYQSNGACHDTCAGYSYGIVQYDKCWCSNEAPGDTVSVSSCNAPCPGYPKELCGNEDSGLYGYVYLGKTPERTADSGSGSSSPPPVSTQPQAPPTPDTVTQVVTSVAVSIQSSPPQTPTSSSAPTSTWTPTPSPSILTVSGSIRTVVITPTRPPQATTTISVSDPQPVAQNNSGFFSNKGAVAGVFTVVGILILALIVAGLVFFWRRKTKDQEGSERLHSMEEDRNSIVPSTFMSRRTSELGLRTDLPRVQTSDEKTPTSMHMPGMTSRRTSMPLTDQRLNPANLFHDNGSHLSVTSLQDNRDYSRPVLQIANPDRPGSSAIDDD